MKPSKPMPAHFWSEKGVMENWGQNCVKFISCWMTNKDSLKSQYNILLNFWKALTYIKSQFLSSGKKPNKIQAILETMPHHL